MAIPDRNVTRSGPTTRADEKCSLSIRAPAEAHAPFHRSEVTEESKSALGGLVRRSEGKQRACHYLAALAEGCRQLSTDGQEKSERVTVCNPTQP
jgi:hypothetical protein